MMLMMVTQEQVQLHRQFVSDHMAYNRVLDECKSWCQDAASRLELCLAADSSIESQLNQLNELSSQCSSEGADCIQRVRSATTIVLLSTSVTGVIAVNEAVSSLVAYWESLVDKISSAHDKMEYALVSCNEFDASVSKLLQQLHDAEEEQIRLSVLQSTLTEKVSCSERARVGFLYTNLLH